MEAAGLENVQAAPPWDVKAILDDARVAPVENQRELKARRWQLLMTLPWRYTGRPRRTRRRPSGSRDALMRRRRVWARARG